MQPIDQFCCRNKECADHGVRAKADLSFRGWSGRGKRIRMIFCRTCKARFSERKGTVLEQSRLGKEKVLSVPGHIREGCGTRPTGRLIGVDKNTVTRYVRVAGAHAVAMHDELVGESPRTKEVQLDEKWGFVGNKEENEEDDSKEPCCGPNWDHTAVDAESRLLLGLAPGKRTADNCLKLIEDVKKRTGGRTDIFHASDEHAPYTSAIEQVYARELPQPKRTGPDRKPKPKKAMPRDLCYAAVRKTRKKNRVVQVERTVVFGTAMALLTLLGGSTAGKTINTSFVERNNGADRHQNARKVRKTCCFSKDWDTHNAASLARGEVPGPEVRPRQPAEPQDQVLRALQEPVAEEQDGNGRPFVHGEYREAQQPQREHGETHQRHQYDVCDEPGRRNTVEVVQAKGQDRRRVGPPLPPGKGFRSGSERDRGGQGKGGRAPKDGTRRRQGPGKQREQSGIVEATPDP